MKKGLLMLVLALCCCLAQGIHSFSSKSSGKDSSKAKTYYGYAEDYEKKAKKLEDAGNSQMAECMRNCAKAKRMIADGYKKGDKNLVSQGNAEYAKAREALKSTCESGKTEKCAKSKKDGDKNKSEGVKDADNDSSEKKSGDERKAERYLKKAEIYSKKAEKYESQGKTSLAKRYRDLADKLSKKAEQEESENKD